MTAILNFIRYMHALVLLSVPHESFNDWGRVFNGCSESTNMCAVITQLIPSILMVGVVAAVAPYESHPAAAAMMWSVMPIVGAFLASTMAFLLNRVSENRRAVTGRVIGALVLGVSVPRLLTYVHPWVKDLSMDPILLILSGFASGLLGYAAAAHIVDRFFKDGPSIVDKGMEKITDSISTKVAEKMSAPVLPPGD